MRTIDFLKTALKIVAPVILTLGREDAVAQQPAKLDPDTEKKITQDFAINTVMSAGDTTVIKTQHRRFMMDMVLKAVDTQAPINVITDNEIIAATIHTQDQHASFEKDDNGLVQYRLDAYPDGKGNFRYTNHGSVTGDVATAAASQALDMITLGVDRRVAPAETGAAQTVSPDSAIVADPRNYIPPVFDNKLDKPQGFKLQNAVVENGHVRGFKMIAPVDDKNALVMIAFEHITAGGHKLVLQSRVVSSTETKKAFAEMQRANKAELVYKASRGEQPMVSSEIKKVERLMKALDNAIDGNQEKRKRAQLSPQQVVDSVLKPKAP